MLVWQYLHPTPKNDKSLKPKVLGLIQSAKRNPNDRSKFLAPTRRFSFDDVVVFKNTHSQLAGLLDECNACCDTCRELKSIKDRVRRVLFIGIL